MRFRFPVSCFRFPVSGFLFPVACFLIACGPAPSRPLPEQVHVTPTKATPEATVDLDAALADNDPIAIIRAAGAFVASGGDIALHRAAVWAAIDRADRGALEAVVATLDANEPAGAVRLRLALLAAHAGEIDAAHRYLDDAASSPELALPPLAERAKTIAGAVPSATVDPDRIAILLPTTGPHSGIGKELLAAAHIAVAGTPAKLFAIDTRGDADAARDAVDQAIARGAIAIVGPVGEREAIAAARRAAERRIPIGLLAPSDGADPASGVFRLVNSPADEARMAIQVAAELSFPTVAVLAPRDDVGTEIVDAFVAAAAAKRLDVTARGHYDPSAQDLQPDVKAFLGLDPLTNDRLRAHLRRYGKRGWQTFSPDVPFSMLYVPDRHDRAALVASFLPYLGVELHTQEFLDMAMLKRKHRGRIPQIVQLVGDGGWNHPGLLTRGGPAVEGAMIVDTFGGELDAAGGGDFHARYRDATGRAPSSAAAQVHDAVRLVLAARARGRPTTRAGLAAALRRASIDDGACGAAVIDSTGEVVRDPVVLQVDNGELVLAP